MIPTVPYPLVWPEGVPRTAARQDDSFRTDLAKALANVERSVLAFGQDSGRQVERLEITSNVVGIRKAPITDPGVAVWFVWDGQPRCFAIDRYRTVAANLQAIHHVIEARRTELRHGGLHVARAAFRGFTAALPAPDARAWWDVLGVPRNATPPEIDAAYKARARALAARDDQQQMKELNVARDQAKAARGGDNAK